MSNDAVEHRDVIRRVSALHEMRRYQEAVTEINRAIAADPDEAAYWCLLAVSQLNLPDKDHEALASAGRALALSPDSDWPHRLSSIALGRLRRHDEAIAEARQAVRLDPHDWTNYTCLSRSLRTRHAQATALALNLARHYPSQGSAYLNSLLPPPTDLEEARDAATTALELAPLEPETHIALGLVEAADGNRKAAQAAYLEALELDPENVSAHNALAQLHLHGPLHPVNPRGLAKAASGFASAVRVDPAGAKASRRNLDMTVRVFMARTSYLLFVTAWIVAQFDTASGAASRVIPLVLLLVPVLFAGFFLTHLTPDLRRFVWRAVGHPRLRLVAAAAELASMGLIVAGSAAPQAERAAFGFAAAGCAIVGRLTLRGAAKREMQGA